MLDCKSRKDGFSLLYWWIFYWYTNKVLLFHLPGDVKDLVKVDFSDWFFRLKRSTYTSQIMICIVGVNLVLARTMNSRNLSGMYVVLLCLRIRLGTKALLQTPITKICHIQLVSFTCIHNELLWLTWTQDYLTLHTSLSQWEVDVLEYPASVKPTTFVFVKVLSILL